jgi:hypothetical protein
MPEDFAIDRLLGLELYGIPLRPWFVTGHVCPFGAALCCAGEFCEPVPGGVAVSEFSGAVSWSEVAEVVELYEHEHKHTELIEFDEHGPEPAEPAEPVESEDDDDSDEEIDLD